MPKLKWWQWTLIGLVVLSIIGALTGGDESPAPSETAEQTAAPQDDEPQDDEPQDDGCQKPTRALRESLRSALNVEGRGGLKRISVVEVTDPPPAALAGYKAGVYAVAAEITGPGIGDGEVIGVWAVSRDMVRTGGGLAIGADTLTREFSELGAAARRGSPAADYAEAIANSDAGQRARDCATP